MSRRDITFWRCDTCGLELEGPAYPDSWLVTFAPQSAETPGFVEHHCEACVEELRHRGENR